MQKKSPDKLIVELLNVRDMSGRLGRWRTMHKLDDAIKEARWELADILSDKQYNKEIGL